VFTQQALQPKMSWRCYDDVRQAM